MLLEYKEIDPYRVHLPTLHHYLTAQQETVHVMQHGIFSDFKTERMFSFAGDNSPLKIPDVLFIEQVESVHKEGLADQFTAIEIELTPKWNHHLDLFVTNIVTDIQDGRIWHCIIISDSPAILARYKAAFEPGRVIKLWDKSSRAKVTDTGKTLTLPDWVPKHIFFRQVGSAAPYPSFMD